MVNEGGTQDDPEHLAVELLSSMRAVRRLVRRTPAPSGLSSTQSEVLRLIVKEPQLSVASLASTSHVAPNTLSTLLGQLVDLGYVVRHRDPADLRVARYEASEKGHAHAEQARDHHAAAVTTALQQMRPDDRAALQDAIEALKVLAELLT